MIGPQIPAHLLNRHEEEEEEEEKQAPLPIGPQVPLPTVSAPLDKASVPPEPSTSKRILGPSLPPAAGDDDSDGSDDSDIGPKPLPSQFSSYTSDGVREFLEREDRRRQLAEDAAKPPTLKRQEWMLVPPSSSGVLGSLDIKHKPRQFSRSSGPKAPADTTLWTETPAERQQRIADEVMGKKRRAVNADPAQEADQAEDRKKRRKNAEIKETVDEYTRKVRGQTLLDIHEQSTSKKGDDGDDVDRTKYFGIWDHSRDMSIGGRLLDDSTRNKLVKDAKGLGDRFGHGKHGGFL